MFKYFLTSAITAVAIAMCYYGSVGYLVFIIIMVLLFGDFHYSFTKRNNQEK